MKKLMICCVLLVGLCVTAFASDAARADVQRLETELATATDPVVVKHLKIALEELYLLSPPAPRSGNLDDDDPENDDCDDAIGVAIGSTTAGTTLDATFDDVENCGTSNTAPGVWYSVIGNGNELTASTCNQADYDTKISVFKDGCDVLTCVGGNDDGHGCSGFTSKVSWCAEDGVEYLILVHGYGSACGNFDLSIIDGDPCGPPPEPPVNDDCADAIPVAVPSVTPGSTVLAGFDHLGGNCGTFFIARGVWYSVIGNGNELTASTCQAADYDTKISVFRDGCDVLTCVDFNDDAGGCGLTSEVTWCSEPGVEYLVFVHGFFAVGDFDLSIIEGDPCGCDEADEALLYLTGELPQCQCMYICADQPLTICVAPLEPHQTPIAFTMTPGCLADPISTPQGCDEECPPAAPQAVSDWVYDPNLGGWCIMVVADNEGCFCFCLDDYLPVELSSFTAVAGDGEITLHWSTASESDNDYFDIERDGAIVGRVNASNSPTGSDYSWTEDNLTNGAEYSYSLIAVSISGLREVMATASATPSFSSTTVSEFTLHQNYPNPFNPETSIAFDLTESGLVHLSVYDALGRTVATLANGNMNAGRHQVTFNAADLPSGLYFYRLETGDFTAIRKMILMK